MNTPRFVMVNNTINTSYQSFSGVYMSQTESFRDTVTRVVLTEAKLFDIVKDAKQLCKKLDNPEDVIEVAVAILSDAGRSYPQAVKDELYKYLRALDRLHDKF